MQNQSVSVCVESNEIEKKNEKKRETNGAESARCPAMRQQWRRRRRRRRRRRNACATAVMA